MTFLNAMAVCVAASGLLLGLLTVRRRRQRPRRLSGFLEVSPRYQRLLRRLGLTEPGHFLALSTRWPPAPADGPGVQHVVSGHPDRHVARVLLGMGSDTLTAFLKREHRISWRTRLLNALAGAGFLSRSLREARLLQDLEREQLGGPEWLAVGEDGRGQGFLLVREVPDALELRDCLRQANVGAPRRQLARRLGRTLAALHHAGFAHPDLYANHVLVQRDGKIHLLDWQRSRRMRQVPWRLRCRDLATLHATLAEALASPLERLICLRAYLGTARILLASPDAEAPALPLPDCWQTAAAEITARSRRWLRHRHIREKRQAQAPVDRQAWICLADQELCLTPAMAEQLGEDTAPSWLTEPLPAGSPRLSRRWVEEADGSWKLLVQRQQSEAMRRWWRRGGGAEQPPEQQQAGLLFRLQRHGVASPRLLAMGQRRRSDGSESLLLTQPLPATCSMEAWLARQARGPLSTRRAALRRQVFWQTGVLLQQLHEASCYLELDERGCGLAVQLRPDDASAPGSTPAVVLETAECVHALRRRHPRRARRNLVQLARLLQSYGGTPPDVRRFLAGYKRTAAQRELDAAPTVSAKALPAPAPAEKPRDNLWQRIVRGTLRLRQRADWALFAGPGWAERIMDVAVTDDFHSKQGRSTGRWILPRPAGASSRPSRLSVYLKRHYRLPWLHGVLATLWPEGAWSPALQEWAHLVWARQQGIPVPEVVAAGERIGPWGRLQSFLVVEELTGMLPLSEAVPLASRQQSGAAFRAWKRGLIAEMARLSRLLHDRRCFHKDLYLCHFYISRQDVQTAPACWRGRVHLIDLHRLQHHPHTWQMWRLKDLAQLLYSSETAGVEVRDRLLFWREYRGTGPRRGRGRWLRRLVIFKWRRYRLHNQRQKARLAAPEGPGAAKSDLTFPRG